MFGLGIWEFALILIIALLVLGPEKLPKVARQLGRGMREVRRAVSEFQSNLASVDIEQEMRRRDRNAPRIPPVTENAAPVPDPTTTPATDDDTSERAEEAAKEDEA